MVVLLSLRQPLREAVKRLILVAVAAVILAVPALVVSAQECPPEGSASSRKFQALNILKNREVAPRSEEMDASVTLDAMLQPGDDTGRFDEMTGGEIIGYVVRVLPGGKESTNCDAREIANKDTHIELAQTPDAAKNERIIVEVTPRWRALMAGQGVDWSTPTLEQSLPRHQVRVRGWLLFDFEHRGKAENTAPGNSTNWRATVWEIHPITALEIIQ